MVMYADAEWQSELFFGVVTAGVWSPLLCRRVLGRQRQLLQPVYIDITSKF